MEAHVRVTSPAAVDDAFNTHVHRWQTSYGGGEVRALITSDGDTHVRLFDLYPAKHGAQEQYVRLNTPQLAALAEVIAHALDTRIDQKLMVRE